MISGARRAGFERVCARAAVPAILLLVPVLLGPSCDPKPSLPVTVTLNAIPEEQNGLVVVPPSGFTVDVGLPEPDAVDPGTRRIELIPFGGGPVVDLTPHLVVDEPDRAVVVVPASAGLEPGSYHVVASAERLGGGGGGAVLAFAVREHPPGGPPLREQQWVQLDFDADPDGDGVPDLEGDLAAFGLLGSAPSFGPMMRSWVVAEVLARAEAFYTEPDPSDLPGGDAAEVRFSAGPPDAGPSTRICVGGEDPSGQGVVGNVLFDPGNADLGEVACDAFLPAGVFPRELLGYAGSAAFQDVFGPVLDTPVGEHPLDAVIFGPSFDPKDPAQLARLGEVRRAVEAFSQVVATVTAHEAGHAIGLVPRGTPGGGLFGGASGLLDTHNVTPEGTTPPEPLLMNAGPSFSFATLAGEGAALPRLRELNFAYLRGRLVLDPRVTGIYPAPVLDYATPSQISLGGPPVLGYTCLGDHFRSPVSIRLVGPLGLGLLSETLVSEQEVAATIPVLQLAVGTYALELTNGDGQVVVLDDAVEVVP